MEVVHNYVDIMFMYRAVDYSGKALLRVCHDIRYFERMVSRDKEGERKKKNRETCFVHLLILLLFTR